VIPAYNEAARIRAGAKILHPLRDTVLFFKLVARLWRH
jgi:hypothetical protein